MILKRKERAPLKKNCIEFPPSVKSHTHRQTILGRKEEENQSKGKTKGRLEKSPDGDSA